MDLEHHRAIVRLEKVTPGTYRSVRFHVGLDAADNAASPGEFTAEHPLNPNVNGLHWSWQGGYVFLALEGYYRTGAGEPKGFSYHLARETNRTCITLPVQIDLSLDTTLQVDLDVARLLNASARLSFEKDGSSTHSRAGDPIAAALVANLPGAFRVMEPEAGRYRQVSSSAVNEP